MTAEDPRHSARKGQEAADQLLVDAVDDLNDGGKPLIAPVAKAVAPIPGGTSESKVRKART